jgi:hypothetical protein
MAESTRRKRASGAALFSQRITRLGKRAREIGMNLKERLKEEIIKQPRRKP